VLSVSCLCTATRLQITFDVVVTSWGTRHRQEQHGMYQTSASRQKVQKYLPIIGSRVNGKAYHNSQAACIEPNQRLQTVFGTDNAFTNPNKKKDIPQIQSHQLDEESH
jgi:hypothetical protein